MVNQSDSDIIFAFVSSDAFCLIKHNTVPMEIIQQLEE